MNTLRWYWNETKQWPDTIVVYRDGVSDGQIPLTADQEAKPMLDAIKALSPSKTKISELADLLPKDYK